MSKLIQITQENINEILNASEKLLVLEFYAEWCPPCKALMPVLEELSQEYADKAIFAKVDVDKFINITSEYGIRKIPHLLILKNGELIKNIGVVDPKAKAFLQQHLDALI